MELRVTSYNLAAEGGVQRLRVKQHKAGRRAKKPKVPLRMFARGVQTFAFGKPDEIVEYKTPEGRTFNQYGLWLDEKTGRWIATQKLLPVKRVTKLSSTADVKLAEYNQINRLLKHLLLFKGIGYADVRRDFALGDGKPITYRVLCELTYNGRTVKVANVTVKKSFEDGIFFCSKTCNEVKAKLAAINLTSNEVEIL